MDDYNKSNVDDNSNSDISSEVNEQDNSTSENVQSGNEQSNDNGIGNGYNQLAPSNREAFTKGLNQNYADRIAQNKANLEQARARSRETQKTNNKGEQQDKNGLDKVKDQANILKSKASLLSTKIDSARAGAYKAMHSVEAAKIAAKEAVKRKIITIALSSLAGCAPFLLGVFVIFIAVFVVLGIFSSDTNANTGSNIQECGFTISRTSLSKSEYKNKLEEFANNVNSNLKIFADNASSIYDYARSKNINPELVPVRAVVEGNGTETGNNNYWGMGCTNGDGIEACYDYNTFAEGYTDFINNISRYNSLADMMTNYAYIGDYWFTLDTESPSADGGCYYAKYIYPNNMPDRVKNACASGAPSCTINGSKNNCIATTEEDQLAYAKYQIEISMATIRSDIFGLQFTDGPCTNASITNNNVANAMEPNWSSDAWKAAFNPYSAGQLYGQCTWFAWGRFYEIYGYSPGFTGNGVECASQLVSTHPDKFEKSSTPKSGAVFSCTNREPWGHVGIVLDFDGTNITIQEGNLDGDTNTFEFAKKDWQQITMKLSDWHNTRCYNAVYANPK